MIGLNRFIVLILVGLSAGFGSGCGKKAGETVPDAAADAAAQKLPGADQVTAALARKDYDGTMAALLKVRQGVANNEQLIQYTTLAQDVKSKLIEAAPNDPKAAEALASLRAMTLGR